MNPTPPAGPHPALTVLSLGVGLENTAGLSRFVEDRVFRTRYAPGRLLVLFSDTGDEHPETYDALLHLKAYCLAYRVELVHITPALGFHRPAWQSLRHFGRGELWERKE